MQHFNHCVTESTPFAEYSLCKRVCTPPPLFASIIPLHDIGTCAMQLPFFFVGSLTKEWSALANAVACGVMIAASFDLVHEAEPYGAGLTILGVVLGE